MKILWMKPVLPYPPTQGTKRVTLQILANLVPRHRVRLFARLVSRDETRAVEELQSAVPGLEVRAPLAPNRVSVLHRAAYRLRIHAALRRGIPPVETYTALPPLLAAFAEEAAAFGPDLVVAEYWYGAPYLRAAGPGPKALFAHDIEYLARGRTADGGLHVERSRRGGRVAMEREREQRALREAPAVWFLTPADRDAAVATAGVAVERTEIVPYGLDLAGELARPGRDEPAEDGETVLLFGSYAADFNRDALEHTLDAVWPEILSRRPSARLLVAGGGLPDRLRERALRAGAEVRGEVQSVRRLLLSASVVLVPLRYGGGLRIRLLESLALERAVVGTPVGVLGMGPERDREVLAADTPAGLAGEVARALDDPALRRHLGEAGRRWVQERHDAAAAARAHLEIVERARERGSSGDAAAPPIG